MRKFWNVAKVSMMAFIGVLFLGAGMKAEAAGAATNVKQVGADSSRVQVDFTRPADEAGFFLECSQSKTFTGAVNKTDSKDSAYTEQGIIQNLSPGSTYYVRVISYDKEGNLGAPSNVAEVVTSPSLAPSGLKQTKAAEKKISFSWKKASGANVYDVGYIKYGSSANVKYKTVGNVSSYAFSTAKNTKYEVVVYAGRKSSTGYIAWSASDKFAYSVMSPLPTKVTKVKMVTSGSDSNSNATQAYFTWSDNAAADGYEYIVYGNNGKKLFSGSRSTYKGYIMNGKLKNTQFMKIKVRAYVRINGKKKAAGKWSDDCWFAKYPKSVKKKEAGNMAADGAKISWSKITGAKNYTVYISTNPNSGWKKAGTTKKTSLVVKKCGGSSIQPYVTYYYKVVASKKVKNKTYKSDDSWYGKFQFVTTYY